MRGIQSQAGKRNPAKQVTHHRRQFIPDDVIHDREFAAHHQSSRKQKHVDDRMLEGHAEEDHDRHPHGDHLAAHRGGNHRPPPRR